MNTIAVNGTRQSNVGKYISKENLPDYLSEVSMDDIPWAVNFLVSKLVMANNKAKPEEATHKWNDYRLSPEIEALSSFERTELPHDYDKALAEILERKYR